MENKTVKKNKKKRNILIAIVVLFVFIIGNVYIYGKLSKVEEGIYNPYAFLIIININVVFFLTILALTLRYFIKLFFEESKSRGKLRKKLTVILLSLVIIPSMIISIASISLISNATNIWFSGKVEEALKTIDDILEKNIKEYVHMCDAVSKLVLYEKIHPQKIIRYFELNSIVIIKNGKKSTYGKPLSSISYKDLINKNYIIFYIQDKAYLRYIKKDNGTIVIIDKKLPDFLSKKNKEVKSILKLYSQFRYYKNPIRIGYILTMLIITMFIILAAIWFSHYIVKNLTYPLEQLAEAAKRLAKGNLNVRVNITSKDEIGILIEEFNHMVEQLQSLYKQLEVKNKELQYSNQYLETILETAKTGVIFSDKEGKIQKINSAALKILGTDKKQVVGKDIIEFLKELGLDPKDLEKGSRVQYNGKILLMKLTKIQGTKKGYVLVIDDITNVVHAEKILAWKEIAQRIAHEIKNPLTPIRLSAERIIIQHQRNNPNFPKILEKATNIILKEVDYLSNLVREFNQFASIQDKLKKEKFSLNQLLQELKDSYETTDFKVEIEAEKEFTIFGDKTLIRQALANLIQNSYEATEGQKERWVKIKVYQIDDKLVIEVIDNGAGISKEDLEKIFSPYFSKKVKGSGLGLSITKEIIELHQGTIKAVNSEKGAHFIIELPLK
ncbi:MAG: HAMP domain-containing protein [Aquificae bacterium]|nr:HAMP domain-containing protein [Aquificota bacterium]